MDTPLFHLAVPIQDVEAAKVFYVDGLGCTVGRESAHAVIFGFYGHQVVAHITKEPLTPQNSIYPRHFGLVFPTEADWEKLLKRAQTQQLKFREEPKRRFPGKITDHLTFFLEDPFYNLLEFKYYYHSEAILGKVNLGEIGDRA
jgi:extradiol dioxygenase family protein